MRKRTVQDERSLNTSERLCVLRIHYRVIA